MSTSKSKNSGKSKTHDGKTQPSTTAPKGKPKKKDDAVELDDEVLEGVRGGAIPPSRMYREGKNASLDCPLHRLTKHDPELQFRTTSA